MKKFRDIDMTFTILFVFCFFLYYYPFRGTIDCLAIMLLFITVIDTRQKLLMTSSTCNLTAIIKAFFSPNILTTKKKINCKHSLCDNILLNPDLYTQYLFYLIYRLEVIFNANKPHHPKKSNIYTCIHTYADSM